MVGMKKLLLLLFFLAPANLLMAQEKAAALKIQTSARGRAARVEKVRRVEKKHATVLQQLCRRQLARQQSLKQSAAAQRVQVRWS